MCPRFQTISGEKAKGIFYICRHSLLRLKSFF